MAVTSQPALYVNGRNLNNWFSSEILWKQTEGLMDGAALEPGATVETFDGKAKVRAHDMAYQVRRVVITGRIINRSGWLDKQKAIADLAAIFAGQPAIVRLGTLYLEAEFGPVKLVDDAYSHLPGYQTWRVEGEAIPGTFFGQYHTAIGADQGLAVQDDRPDSSAVKFTSNSFTYACPGTAPTEACLSLTGTASTTYYLKGKGLRRVPMTTDSAGNASIDEASGFVVYPGANSIRVEDSAGNLAGGVTAVNLYGTRPRFLGNAPTAATTQSATTNRMSEGPMLTVARTGSASYIGLAGTLTTVTDGQARIGLPYVVRRNLVASSQDFLAGTWGKSNISVAAGQAPGPDGQMSVSQLSVTNGSSNELTTTVPVAAGQSYVLSFYAMKGTATSLKYSVWNDTAGGNIVAPTNYIGSLNTSTPYRVTVPFTAPAGCSTVRIWLNRDGGATGTFYATAVQVEPGSTATPYQATNASGVDLTSSINGAGLVLEGAGTNLVYNSSAQVDTAGWFNGGNPNSVNRATTASCPTISTAIYCTYPGSGVAMLRTTPEIACVAGDVFTVSGWFYKDPGVGGARWRLFWSNSGNSAEYSPSSAGAWQWMTATFTVPAGVTSLSLQYFADGGSAGSNLYVTDLQIEKNPFATSIIRTTTGAATRSADICGIVSPHNLLKWSEGFDNSVWTLSSTTLGSVVSGPGNATNARSFNVGSGGSVRQVTDLQKVAGRAFAVALWARVPSGTSTVRIICSDFVSTNIDTRSYTVGTTWTRIYATGTFPLSAPGFITMQVDFNGAAGTLELWGASAVEGSHPGIYVRTTDTAIPAPTSPALDPAWMQNGYVEFDVMPPSISSGLYYSLLGVPFSFGVDRYNGWGTSVYALVVNRESDVSGTAGLGGYNDVGISNIWDGAKHKLRIEWTNYTISGVRYMYKRLYVDGTLYGNSNVAADKGATSWATIDPSKLISSGNTFATLSNITLGYPALPQGAIPAA